MTTRKMATENRRLLKVLVVHGYRQNASSSYEKTGAFRKGLKKFIELVYITAPHKIPDTSNSEEDSEKRDEYGWWFSAADPSSFSSLQETEIDLGHEESIKLIEETFKEKGPFDGILGFSQGATIVAHICALRDQPDSPFKFTFAMLCAGFKSKSPQHEKCYQNRISCPSLHIFGDSDKVIAGGNAVFDIANIKELSKHFFTLLVTRYQRSEELSKLFDNPVVLNHAGGHFLPATSKEKKIYQNFLETFITS